MGSARSVKVASVHAKVLRQCQGVVTLAFITATGDPRVLELKL